MNSACFYSLHLSWIHTPQSQNPFSGSRNSFRLRLRLADISPFHPHVLFKSGASQKLGTDRERCCCCCLRRQKRQIPTDPLTSCLVTSFQMFLCARTLNWQLPLTAKTHNDFGTLESHIKFVVGLTDLCGPRCGRAENPARLCLINWGEFIKLQFFLLTLRFCFGDT